MTGRGGRAAWSSAIIQSAGTLFFNRTTFHALQTAVSSPDYNRLVWRPDALGSICFLVSGAIAYLASPRHGWLPVARGARMVAAGRQPARLHLLRHLGNRRLRRALDRLGPGSGRRQLEHLLGAACFLACALSTLVRPATAVRSGSPIIRGHVIDRLPTAPIAAAGLIAGYAVAVATGSRPLGGLVLALCGVACIGDLADDATGGARRSG